MVTAAFSEQTTCDSSRENQVCLAAPGAEPAGAAAAAARFRVGDPVTVIADVARCRQLADGHGGWAESMRETCGQSGVVRQVDGDGDVNVTFPDGQSWTFNPAALIGGGGTQAQRPTVGDLVRIRAGRDTRGLTHGESYRITRDDHGKFSRKQSSTSVTMSLIDP